MQNEKFKLQNSNVRSFLSKICILYFALCIFHYFFKAGFVCLVWVFRKS
jgi:hypothetical protein